MENIKEMEQPEGVIEAEAEAEAKGTEEQAAQPVQEAEQTVQEASPPQPSQPPGSFDITQLPGYKEYQRRQSKLDQKEKELSRNLSKLGVLDELVEENRAIKRLLKSLMEGLPEIVGRQTTEVEGLLDESAKPKMPSKVEKALQEEKNNEAIRTQRLQLQAAFGRLIDRAVASAGLDANDERLAKARELWQRGEYAASAEEAQSVSYAVLNEKRQAYDLQDQKAKAVANERKQLKESGLLKAEIGNASGAVYNTRDARLDAYIRGEVSWETYRKWRERGEV